MLVNKNLKILFSKDIYMSLLLLKGRKAPTSVKSSYVPRDYAIWDQQDDEQDMDVGPQQQKTIEATTNNQLGFLMRKTWRTPIPVGTVVQYAGNDAPIGWLFCKGDSLSRDEYPDLFDIIGTTYGSTSITTFKVPDFRQRIPMGFDISYNNNDTRMDLNLNILGATGGELEHTLDRSEMPSHTHGPTNVDGSNNGTGLTGDNGSHDHTFQMKTESVIGSGIGTTAVVANNDQGDGGSDDPTTTTTTEPNHSHTIGNTGGNLPHNIVQKYVVVNYIIKW
jgi:microcystin-dependent protein